MVPFEGCAAMSMIRIWPGVVPSAAAIFSSGSLTVYWILLVSVLVFCVSTATTDAAIVSPMNRMPSALNAIGPADLSATLPCFIAACVWLCKFHCVAQAASVIANNRVFQFIILSPF